MVKGQITAVETGGAEQPQWGKLLVSCGSVLSVQPNIISHNQLSSLSCRTTISSCKGVATDTTATMPLPIHGIRIREGKHGI